MIEKFLALTNILIKHQASWQKVVFKDTNTSHLSGTPKLVDWLLSLSDQDLLALQTNDQKLLTAVEPLFEDASEIARLINFPSSIKQKAITPLKFWDKSIPGRKAEQVLAFSQSLGSIDLPILEWCCGKQHLGRFLSMAKHQNSTGLEIAHSLVKEANILSQKQSNLEQVKTFQCDVFSSEASNYIFEQQHVVALHACGGLHIHLLKACSLAHVKRISISPCCYHRFNSSNAYQALSKAGQNSSLSLNMDDLRLATRETKTASNAETEKRRTLQQWRLGFDCLQRDHMKTNDYLDVPTLNTNILKAGFKQFCLHIASLKNINLIEETINFELYEKNGAQRFHLYERLELFRMIFRRALEAWLILDRAIFLTEQGYKTEVGIFCSSDISPRNFFIDAELTER